VPDMTVLTIMRRHGTGGRLLVLVCITFLYVHSCLMCYVIGASLLSSLRTAVIMKEKHRALFNATSNTFRKELLDEWESMVVAWEKDMSNPDPYSEGDTGKLFRCLCL
jgi:hypothetical protein